MSPIDPARAAYEARWAGMTLGPQGAAPAWDDLPPEGRAVWQRVADAAIAAGHPWGTRFDSRRERRRLASMIQAVRQRVMGEAADAAAPVQDSARGGEQ